jgi:hypothetical protein
MEDKVGRNDPCPCGSGQKFKKCCYGKPPKLKFTAKVIKSKETDVALKDKIKTSVAGSAQEEQSFKMTTKDFRVTKK